MDRPGTTLGGRYRLGATIGTGGMSDVYAATDELLGRDVAVKMMRPELARDTSFLDRFKREALNAAKLNHPAIVAVYDIGETNPDDGQVPYIVMERVHGETLSDIIKTQGKMGLTRAASVMAEVCDALHFSHEAGIIHRDIKPANIMITNTGAVKVMDFGIARALSDSSATMTKTSAVIGTAQYLSPEQARGKSSDSRSDIYGAGCVFYELATGVPPFKGDSPFSVALQHVQEQVVRPSTISGMHLSKREALSLDSIVLTAMAKSPADRYDDAQEMATDLRRLANDHMPLVAQPYVDDASGNDPFPTQAAPAQPPADPTIAIGVPPVGPASAAVPAAAVPPGAAAPVAAAAAADQYGQYPPADYPPADYAPAEYAPEDYDTEYEYEYEYEEEPKRRRTALWLWALLAAAVIAGGGFAAYTLLGSPSASTAQVTIPDVKNLPRAEAEQRLRNIGLPVDVTEQNHAEIPRGTAIGTDPAAASTVPEGTTVKLLVSSGKEITEVPDLTNLTTEEANAALKKAGLRLNETVSEESSANVEKGKIISQNPAQGSMIAKGTKVTITVSTGEAKVRVPTVTGQSLDLARTNLEAAGLRVVVNQADSAEPENKVLSATLEGSEVEKGTEVTVTVSRNNQFQMPSLQGKPFGEVFRQLQAAGWRGTPAQVTRRDVPTTDLTRIEQVATQTVKAGDFVNRDIPVEVGVYVFGL